MTAQREAFGAAAVAMIEHLNSHHDDTLSFLARALGPCPDARGAALVRVDADGIELSVAEPRGANDLRLAFAARAESVLEARRELLALVARARERSGEGGQTSIEREAASRAAIRTFICNVAAVERIDPHMVEITIAGRFDGFAPLAPDQFVYVLAPPRGRHQLTIDESFRWEAVERMPPAERPIGAYYTVRRWRPEAREIDLWVVLHGADGDGAWWAQHARPGDPVALWGPREVYARPADCTELVLLGDETALPAIAAILESLPAGDRVRALIELPREHDAFPLESLAELELTWLPRNGAPAGTPDRLLDAVDKLELAPSTYVWGAGELHVVGALRKQLRGRHALPRERVSLTGYWRV